MFELTKNQIEAVQDKNRFLAITAGAGSGKTRVLIERVSYLIEQKLAQLDSILAITFTDKAALELKNRLSKAAENELTIATANIGTFHSFCSRILRENAPEIGLDPDFSVLEEHSAGILSRKSVKETLLRLLAEKNATAELLIEELEFKDAIACVEELMGYRWHAHKLDSHFSGNDREAELRKAALFCFEQAEAAYAAAKGIDLDFQDLEIRAIELLSKSELRAKYQKRFRYILVDEFQDVNDTQAELVGLLYNPKENHLTIVGDPKQSIYRFRGANVHEFEKAVTSAVKTVHLKENFRSAPHILEYINGLFPKFEALVPTKEHIAESAFVVEVGSTDDDNIETMREKEAKAIAGILPSLDGDTACLFYSLNNVDIYSRELSAKGIGHVVHGGSGFLERQDIIDILNALRVLNDNGDAVSLLGLVRSPYIGISDERLFELSINCQGIGKDGRKKLNPELFYKAICKEPQAATLDRLNELKEHLSISELIAEIAGEVRSDNVQKLIDIAKAAESTESIGLTDFIEYLSSIRASSGGIADFPSSGTGQLMLLTIHQAKGLEFDNVILADSVRDLPYRGKKWCFTRGGKPELAFKLRPEDNPEGEFAATELYKSLSDHNKEEDELEKDRLLYVALTRAKKRLIIPAHLHVKNMSLWQEKMLGVALPGISQTQEPRNPGTQPRLQTFLGSCVPRFHNARTTFTVSELESYARCPQEYNMKYVLKAPSGLITAKKDDRLPANIHGDIVHRLIEMDSKEQVASVEDAIEALRVEMEIEEITSREVETIKKQIDNYKRSEFKIMLGQRHELPFMMSLNGNFIKGTLDMLITKPDGTWEIVDFKTGTSLDEGAALNKYGLQIRTYALAAARHLKKTQGKVTLLFLSDKNATEHPLTIDEAVLKSTEEELKDIIAGIAKKDLEIRPEPPCKGCPYSVNKTCWKRTV